MNSNDQPVERLDDSWLNLEEQIRAAGSYVVPSDNLRPRTLEAARDVCSARRRHHKFIQVAASLLLFCVVSIQLADQLTIWHRRSVAPSASELEQQALELARHVDIGPHWGLFEAYSQLRRVQAARLGQTSLSSSVQ